MKHYHAAIAASFMPCHSRLCPSGYKDGNSASIYNHSADVRPGAPCPLLIDRTTQIRIMATFGPGASGCVRVYPDSFSFNKSETYLACPGRPGENQHIARMRARACVFRLLSSDLLFYLLLKVPGQPGQLFNISNLHPDRHPDAPGRPGQPTKRGISLCH